MDATPIDFKEHSYTGLVHAINLLTERLTDSYRADHEHSYAFQNLVTAALELRTRQSDATALVRTDQGSTPEDLRQSVSVILNGNRDHNGNTALRIAARGIIEYAS